MPFYIKKVSTIDSTKTVYYVSDDHWSDEYSKRKTWKTKTSPTKLMSNPDGKNGGWERSTIEKE